MVTWPVFVQSWQLECCGDPFAAGQEVAWMLVLLDARNDDWPWPERLLVDIDAVVGDPATSDDGQNGFLVVAGGITAWWAGDPRRSERFVVRGLFREEHHGGVPCAMPKVRGRVERIRLIRQPYRRVGDIGWEPMSGNWELEDVSRSPSRFRDGQPDGDVALEETGLLVDLLPL